MLGWLVILGIAMLVNSAFAGISQAIALVTRRESTMIAVANFISLPLLFLSSNVPRAVADAALDARRRSLQPRQLGESTQRAL